MLTVDFFTLWRWLLALAVSIYTLIVLGQTALSYWAYLSGGDRYTSILRRYVILHGLRVRAKTFAGDLGVCALLMVTLGLLGWLHWLAVKGAL